MKEEFYCDICNAPMELEVRLPNVHHKGKVYRKRCFKCTVCYFKKIVYASGYMDEKVIPEQGIEKVKSIFKQEEINRLGRPL